MLSRYSNSDPEKYSSFQKRKFHEYKQKAERLVTGINDLLLKDNDKLKLREQLSSILSVPNGEASRVNEKERRGKSCVNCAHRKQKHWMEPCNHCFSESKWQRD